MEHDFLGEPALPLNYTRTYGGNAAFHNFNNDYSHIQDPNERRRLALSEIDKVPFGWYHVRAVVVAGIGFFTDSYDIFAINLVTSILGMVYWQETNYGILPTNVNTALKAATSGGAVLGQIGFGWLADVIGRRKMYGVELAIIILATLAQSLAAPSSAVTMTGLLVFWRVVMGIGIGGDYPLSSVITSEFAPTRWRGAMMAAVFSMQGAGQFAAAIVALITTVGFKKSFIHTTGQWSTCRDVCQLAGDRAWRIIIGFGAVPAVFALYYRITIPETPRYTFDVGHDIEKAQADIHAYMNNQKDGTVDPILQQRTKARIGKKLTAPKASWPDVFAYFSQWANFKIIFSTTASWFFLDLAFYGLGLNASIVLSAIGYSNGDTIYHSLLHASIGSLILVCAGALPGYWLSVATIDTIGRKPIQVGGFFFLTLIFVVIGFAYHRLSERSLLGLYILAQFFFNFGPNTTTFIIPGECFPTRYRSTGHGISAAAGKIGAIVAQVIANPLLTKGASPSCTGNDCSPWLPHLMQIFALFMLCGLIVSFLLPETKGRTLEELAGESAQSSSHSTSSQSNSHFPSSPHAKPPSSNGSITLTPSTFLKRHNPFAGGKPAGFTYIKSPNLGPKSPGMRGKRERVGIMSSPELLPRKVNSKGTGHGRGRGGGSDGSIPGYPVSVESGATGMVHSMGRRRADENDDLYLAGAGGALPGWGAGWSVDRATNTIGGAGRRRDGRVENIMLNDVGKLLK